MAIQDYFNELAATAGLDEESKAALGKVLGNQKFAEELEKSVKRQSDYSRNMDELKTQRQQVESQIGQWREWYAKAAENDAAREAELQELRATRGTTTVTPTSTTPTTGFSKKEIEEREGRMIAVVKQGMRLASRHAAKFGEELDTDALERIAVEKGLTLDRAYDEYVAPRVKEASEKEFAEKIRLAREDGLKEGLSKRNLPDESTRGFHPIFGHAKQVETAGKLTDGQRASGFAEAWESANKK